MPRNVRHKGGITSSRCDVSKLVSPKGMVYDSDTGKAVRELRKKRKEESMAMSVELTYTPGLVDTDLNAKLLKVANEIAKKGVGINLRTRPKNAPAPSPIYTNGRCAGMCDGDCYAIDCPQLLDGEPDKTGRHCPLDRSGDEED